MTLLLLYSHDFEPFTHNMMRVIKNLIPRIIWGPFLWPLEGQISLNKDSKDINFPRQLIKNQAKTSLLLSHGLQHLKW